MTTYTQPVSGPIRVRGNLRHCDITVTSRAVEPAGTAEVTLTAGSNRGADLLERIEVHLDRAEIYISVPTRTLPLFVGSAGLVDIQVTVPAGSDIDLYSASGDITTDGAIGEARIRSGSGDLTLASVGTVNGATGSGDLRVGELEDGLLGTGSGEISVGHCARQLRARSGSGDIALGTTRGGVHLKSGSGDITVRMAGAGEVVGSSGSGDIQTGVQAGLAVLADATSFSGSVRTDLEPASAPEPEEDALRLRLRSSSGSVRLYRCEPVG